MRNTEAKAAGIAVAAMAVILAVLATLLYRRACSS